MKQETVWTIDTSSKGPVSFNPKPRMSTTSPGPQRNPALAFSLSILIWGAGQLYNGEKKLGSLLILLMINSYLWLGHLISYSGHLMPFITSVPIDPSGILVGYGIVFSSGLLIWGFSACQAYRWALNSRTTDFNGVHSPLLPLIGSLFIPGWGQFLNGQTKKGGIFLVLSMAGILTLLSFLLISFLWPNLNTGFDRLMMEEFLAILIVLSPLFFLAWLTSGFDAFVVALDDVRKEPLLRRLEFANNRRRIHGWRRTVLPQVERVIMIILFLVFSLTTSYYYFPKRDYAIMLQHLQGRMTQKQMVLIPHLIDQFLETRLGQFQEPQLRVSA